MTKEADEDQQHVAYLGMHKKAWLLRQGRKPWVACAVESFLSRNHFTEKTSVVLVIRCGFSASVRFAVIVAFVSYTQEKTN